MKAAAKNQKPQEEAPSRARTAARRATPRPPRPPPDESARRRARQPEAKRETRDAKREVSLVAYHSPLVNDSRTRRNRRKHRAGPRCAQRVGGLLQGVHAWNFDPADGQSGQAGARLYALVRARRS